MEDRTYEQQAAWFSEHSIIIAGHGAALTWSAFIKPCTVVIQLYPPHYYPFHFYESLISQSGGCSISWWEGAYIGRNETLRNQTEMVAIQDQLLHSQIRSDRKYYRQQDIHISAEKLAALLKLARERRDECVERGQRYRQT